ncbi:hypothetical protein SAMN05216317_10122 [Nitrosomonas eutropha]|uniref:hypothetical protein n=1 Tax=Nitrosomonas TaxID=914 RepID=UPI0008803438|nr:MULTISPECIES: hypothetical protein [Nitrosomonas]SCX09110.1 hypothetical protein SAMN05216379_10584 [Nitrosomonas eutropha]SDV99399.1 hypothetical protein SAMN05216317_10122 [Nitrosomonas eutropha]
MQNGTGKNYGIAEFIGHQQEMKLFHMLRKTPPTTALLVSGEIAASENNAIS